MPKMTRGMAIILILMILLTAGLVYMNSRRQSVAQQDLPVPVVVTRPRVGSLSRTIRLTGITESRTTVTVLPRISGLLEDLNVSMGDPVQEGQILGHIDSEAFELTLRQAQAALSGAEATYRRLETLYKSNSAPRQSYDEAKAAYEAALAQYDLAALNREWTEIRSPLEGTVLTTHVEEGALLSPQVPLLTIADLSQPELTLDVPEIHYGAFRSEGEKLRVSLKIPALGGESFSCRINKTAPWVAPESKTFRVELAVDDPDRLIRPGMFATALVEMESSRDAAVLDWQALSSDGYLWYLREESIPVKMEYDPPLKGDEGFQAPPGMEDVLFIIEGQHFLTEGVAVRIVEP